MTGGLIVQGSLSVHELIRRSDEHRRGSEWGPAKRGYQQAQLRLPRDPVLAHNLAVCHLALGEYDHAVSQARRAVTLKPDQALSAVVLAKALSALGRREEALPILEMLHRRWPDQDDVRVELARVCLHFTGDMPRARSLAASVRLSATHGDDSLLVDVLSCLYDRDEGDSAEAVSDRLQQVAATRLRLPASAAPAASQPAGGALPAPNAIAAAGPRPAGRLRVGLLSPQFFASPVYFFTIGALRLLAREVDLVVFPRGNKEDWATGEFREIAREWIPCVGLEAESLARLLAAHRLDVLIDLGGWMDPAGLKALSALPAPRIYKWVGGQSATTGLQGLAGFITDPLQSPADADGLHSEPLVRFQGGYTSYTPPPYLPAARAAGTPGHDEDGSSRLGVIANPAKLSRRFLAEIVRRWPEWQRTRLQGGLGPLQLRLVDRRYRHEAIRHRVQAALPGVRVIFEAPDTHVGYLSSVRALHAVLDTFPYSGGLTTTEALCLRVPVLCRTDGVLFCERHTLAHVQFAGLTLTDVSFDEFTGLCPSAPDIDLVAAMPRRHAVVARQWMDLLLPTGAPSGGASPPLTSGAMPFRY